MTSRQPGATPPGHPEPEPAAGAELTAQDWLVRLLPVALLIVVGLAGLRGAVGTVSWDGPLHQDAVIVGVALEAVIATLFAILLVRHGRGSQEPTAVKLREVLLLVLGAAAIGAAVLILTGVHLKGLGLRRTLPPIRRPTATPSVSFRPHPGPGSAPHFPVTVLLYALLVVVLLAGVAVSIWWARRPRPLIALRAGDVIAEDPEQLREAVESGRSALRTVDDARAAIIACYLAMETTLAEHGTARGAAGTPGELLTRATEAGLVRGTAAGQLTALFYEARFSSHPLGHQQREAAERALDELAADLAETEGAAR
ncbi:MAG TPA: DUF4129 domain-containing protein [Streptosporangiaceae bacterium]|nr:DUF4129 domain-containing protein [Streptosporangiaceae bacterium]